MTIICNDCLDEMRKMESESISCICTDPPYGLKFMGKSWDAGLPHLDIWKEALRISKPGTWLLCFGGTRTYHRLTCAIEDAGWEIRDCLMWIYGSGFPKGKGCLKPSYEPIVLTRKKAPKPELNIDKCRIQSEEKLVRPFMQRYDNNIYGKGIGAGIQLEPLGRWPANTLWDEEAAQMLDEQSGITKSISSYRGNLTDIRGNKYNDSSCKIENSDYIRGHNDSGGASRFFYCAKASSRERNERLDGLPKKIANPNYDSGGFSRPTDQPEREIKPTANHHPCVKPLALMEYLIKLVMPKDGVLLDPFAGSGTTLLAAKNLGITAIGIEKELDYCEIARKRILDN